MKAAVNGTLNVSVLDGWWLEGFNGKNGWAFGSPEPGRDYEAQDFADAQSFYDVLANEVAPLFYERDSNGIPRGWVERMRESIISTLVQFSTHRMVVEYAEKAYFGFRVQR